MNNNRGFSLVELLISATLFSLMLGGVLVANQAGQSMWDTVNKQIELQGNIREAASRVAPELRESGKDKDGNIQVTISDNTGFNNTDVIRFSIPLCVCSNNTIDSDGNVAYWGAPLVWGATTCSNDVILNAQGKVDICHLPPGNPANMQDISVSVNALDAHLDHGDWLGDCGTCSVSANKYIEYSINNNNKLVRRILDDTLGEAKQDIYSDNISDFQASINADGSIVTLIITAESATNQNRVINNSRTLKVYLHNRG